MKNKFNRNHRYSLEYGMGKYSILNRTREEIIFEGSYNDCLKFRRDHDIKFIDDDPEER